MARKKQSVAKSSKVQKKSAFQKFFEKKPHIEFFVALLSIPFFLSVLLINANTLRGLNKAQLTPTPGVNVSFPGTTNDEFYAAPIGDDDTPPTVAVQEPCVSSLGPINISSPTENEVVSENPVNIMISYDDSTYCGAAWSYRINGGNWSAYDDRSVALYNLPSGMVKFELRVRSIVTDDEEMLTRNFTYNGSQRPPTDASDSAQ